MEWNRQIGLSTEIKMPITHGLVCFEHFQSSDFKNKGNENIQLIPGSIPTIFNIAVNSEEPQAPQEPQDHPKIIEKFNDNNKSDDSDDSIPISDSTYLNKIGASNVPESDTYDLPDPSDIFVPEYDEPEPPESTFSCTRNVQNQCEQCLSKEVLIEKYQAEIKGLRKKLKQMQNKAYYLETIKSKLNKTLSEMKDQRIVDSKICNALEVC